MHYFCLDIGGTQSRGSLFAPDGTELGRSTAPAGAISLGVEASAAAIGHAWAALAERYGANMPDKADTVLVGGLAGIGLRSRVAALVRRLGDFRSVRFVGDGYGALLHATGGEAGALISVGTGVAAMRLMPNGRSRTVSGWGFPGGDLGSGAWIGLQAIGGLTRYLDGTRTGPVMTAALAADLMAIAGATPGGIMDWLTSGRARQYASLAPAIVTAAEANDAFACDLLHAAAREIVDVADCLFSGSAGAVAMTGGLGAVLLPRCAEHAPRFTWTATRIDALRGLYLLASGQAPDERLEARARLDVADYES